MRVAVIGAGPAGITAAYELTKKNIQVDVYESSDKVGGLAKTIDLWNQKVDLGPHRFFSNDNRVNKLWLEVAKSDYEMVDRLTRIYYKRKFFFYPLKALDALRKLGIFEATACVFSYIKEKVKPTRQDGTFESWVVGKFGRRLFEIFFKTYSEKLWGITCKELDADFAAQRIKKLSLFEAIINSIFGNQGKHKTLVDQFAYPFLGTGMIYERMQDFINLNGGRVHCNAPVRRVLTVSGKVVGIEMESGVIQSYDHVISSMPISHLVTRLPEVPAEVKLAAHSLKFRNTILVFLNVHGKDLFEDNWLYIHSSDLKMGRLTNFRNWVPQLYGDNESSIMTLEYWSFEHEDLWKASDEELISLAKDELDKTGLIKNSKISEGYVHRINRCYPVYETGYKNKLKPVEDYLKSIGGLSVIGRYGSFKYNNQDHSILMGMLAAENIYSNSNFNLWNINTDYDDYQESSVITKTGLRVK
ncbi:MAG TPA: FAD-dependent oxidoreductase [Flavobacterium sp.]|jgi:protoporphyrinogen oxidase